jgi:twinkle protein
MTMPDFSHAIIREDQIDFALYEHETEAKQKVKPASMWIQELIDRLRNPVKQPRALMPWRKTHKLMQFRPGEVTVWGGANGSGKSLVTGQIALSLCTQGEKVCIASFEMKPLKSLERMGRQWSTFNADEPAFRGDEKAIAQFVDVYEQFRDWTMSKLWFYDQQGTVNATQVCAVVRYCVKERGITHFFIDSLMKCVASEDDYNGQKNFVDELTAIARDHNIHIHLIHHIRKPDSEDKKPNKYDYKGTGAITDQVDNVISVWRNKVKEKTKAAGKNVSPMDPDAMLICDKQRNGEWEGNIGLWFDANSQQYLAAEGDEPMSLYVHPED